MRHGTTALGVLVVRRPLVAGTVATLLAVGIGLAVAMPGIRWRGSAVSAEEPSVTIDGPVGRDETASVAVADFALTAQDGRRVRLREQTGKVVLVNFITTRCTTTCVQVTRELRGLQQTLGTRMGRDVVFFSIGVDPGQDTAAALRQFARRNDVEFRGWSFLSGTADELQAARRALGAVAMRVPQGVGHGSDDFEHTITTYLVDRRGVLRKKIPPGVLTLAGLHEIEGALALRL